MSQLENQKTPTSNQDLAHGTCWTRTRRDRTRPTQSVLSGLPTLQDRESDMSDLGRMLTELRANRG